MEALRAGDGLRPVARRAEPDAAEVNMRRNRARSDPTRRPTAIATIEDVAFQRIAYIDTLRWSAESGERSMPRVRRRSSRICPRALALAAVGCSLACSRDAPDPKREVPSVVGADGVFARARAAHVEISVPGGLASLTSVVNGSDIGGLAYGSIAGVLTRARGNVAERIAAHRDGIEQTWTFGERPPCCDDVVVQVGLAGSRVLRTDVEGVHFASPRVRYSHGTFVDASQTPTRVPAIVREGAIELRVPWSVLARASFPATLDPVLAADRSLESPSHSAASATTSSAFGGGVHLVAGSEAGILHVSRLAAGSTDPTDKPGILLDKSAGTYSAATFDGAKFFIVYSGAGDVGVRARIVGLDGSFGPAITIDATAAVRQVAVATVGSTHLVAWTAKDGGALRATRVGTDGTILDASGLSFDNAYDCAVVAAGTRFILGFIGSAINVVPVEITGTIGAKSTLARPTVGAYRMSLAWASGASMALASWTEAKNIRFVRVSATGAFVDTPRTAAGIDFPVPRVFAESSLWLLAWSDQQFLYGGYVNASGDLVAAATKLGTHGGSTVTGVSGSTDGAAHVWMGSSWMTPTRAMRIQKTTLTATAFDALYRYNRQRSVKIASSPSGTSLVGWADDRAGATGTYVIRVDAAGVPLDAKAARVGLSTAYAEHDYALGFGGGKWYLTAPLGTEMEIDSVDPTGAVDAPQKLPWAMREPLLAHDGTRPYLLGSSDGFAPSVEFVPLTPTGTPLTPITVVPVNTSDSSPAIALAGLPGRVLVAWQPRSHSGLPPIQMSIYDSTTSTMGTTKTLYEAGLNMQSLMAATSAFGRFYIGYHDSQLPGSALAPIASDGTVARRLPLGDTRQLLVLTADAEGFDYVTADDYDVRIRRVSGPVPTLTEGFTLPGRRWDFSLASTGLRKAVAAYAVEGRAVTSAVSYGGDLGATCTSSGECESRQCFDGHCCNVACTGQCEACDVEGLVGVCTPVDGKPHGGRAACAGESPYTPCGSQCIGATSRTSCSYAPTAKACSANECATGFETHASTCDGAGKCSDVPKSCGGYGCIGTVCRSICASAADCVPGYYCKVDTCIPRASLGRQCSSVADCGEGTFCTDGVCCEQANCDGTMTCAGRGSPGRCSRLLAQSCTDNAQCATGFCADGVCCESACTAQCAACDVEGFKGSCAPVLGKPRGQRTACASDGDGACNQRSCDGSDTTTCATRAGDDVVCTPAQCAESRRTAESRCDGTGACVAGATASCSGYACASSGGSCLTTCAADAGCSTGYSCVSGACLARVNHCKDDVTSTQGNADVSCLPYRCGATTGTCIGRCASATDCAQGFSCSSAGECEAAATEPADGSGCSLESSARTTNRPSLAWFVAMYLLTRRRGARLR